MRQAVGAESPNLRGRRDKILIFVGKKNDPMTAALGLLVPKDWTPIVGDCCCGSFPGLALEARITATRTTLEARRHPLSPRASLKWTHFRSLRVVRSNLSEESTAGR